ncbi:zinc ribbon domain-containing protein [Paenibacillus allorhizosphaerae]|uniref:DZANK-type domain-containing protein n=1 Tax=Paenibacillus allorhizosphaerae TaxID=2849866 RepID=A0ABN7TQS9_9BACL|nr:zinc ribbon domain-containing protein [Paenibacillus allorhizosphaerae]CAG7651768.1 hypothetical protein PAECIP111802_05065 [Paenibacillus allorhizosphaerae]
MYLYVCPVCKSKNEEDQKYCMQCGTWLLSDRFPAQKVKAGITSGTLYICSFCDTANEPGRNACKKCLKPLFSTEYKTKEINVSASAGSGLIKFFRVIVYILLALAVLLGIVLLTSTVNDKISSIFVTLLLMGIVQLFFGVINPSIIPGGSTSRKQVLGVYGVMILVLFGLFVKFVPSSKLPNTQQTNSRAVSAAAPAATSPTTSQQAQEASPTTQQNPDEKNSSEVFRVRDFEFRDLQIMKSSVGWEATVEVNNAGKDVKGMGFTITFYAEDGKRVGTSQGAILDIRSGESKTVKLITKDDLSKSKSVKAQIDYAM